MTRQIIGKIHLWVGLALCIPLVIIGLTGSVLVFEDELQGTATGRAAASGDGAAGGRNCRRRSHRCPRGLHPDELCRARRTRGNGLGAAAPAASQCLGLRCDPGARRSGDLDGRHRPTGRAAAPDLFPAFDLAAQKPRGTPAGWLARRRHARHGDQRSGQLVAAARAMGLGLRGEPACAGLSAAARLARRHGNMGLVGVPHGKLCRRLSRLSRDRPRHRQSDTALARFSGAGRSGAGDARRRGRADRRRCGDCLGLRFFSRERARVSSFCRHARTDRSASPCSVPTRIEGRRRSLSSSTNGRAG